MLWRLTDLLAGLEIRNPSAEWLEISIQGVSIDSRTLQPGDLFVALSGNPGDRFKSSAASKGDGHRFVDVAVAKGAAAVLVHQDIACTVPVLRVDDTLDALWRLAAYARERCGGQLVALTGSSGKTTARCFLEHLLAGYGPTHASEGSLNNHWGLPLSLMRMPRESRFGILEIGTNHPGEIAPLTRLASPDVAVVLNVLPAHIGNFRNLDQIRVEKLSIAGGLAIDGRLVVPDDLQADEVTQECITFGRSGSARVRCLEVEATENGARVSASIAGQAFHYHVPFAAQHWIGTSLASLAVIHALGLDPHLAAQRMASVSLPEGRGSHHLVAGVGIIDDSYNANPISMQFALQHLRDRPVAGRRIAILGEMLELGDKAAEMHGQLAPYLRGMDQVITVGSGMETLADALSGQQYHCHLRSAADFRFEQFVASLESGDEVLVKGSNRVFWIRGFVPELLQVLARS